MNWLRAVMRRLDPWAAIVLGGLLAMGVVILLATPGPWQKVVHTQPPVRLEAPAPDDVAVFVMGGRGGSCTGILWLHLDAASHGLAAVVVAPRISGFSPTDGSDPVAAIADSAGPGAAAAALGGAIGVSMDAWVALDRSASDLAIQAMFPMNDLRPERARYREARVAWRGRGGDEKAWATQYESLSVALPQVSFADLGVVAFSNYVLGFGFVRSDLTLQAATSLATALKAVDPGQVVVRAAPVVVERSLGGEVWHADTSLVEPLRQSLALGIAPPESAKLVTIRSRAPRVLVIAPLPRAAAQRYAAEVRRRLARSAGAAVGVTLVWGADGRLAFRAARELDRRPALAALVAPAVPGGDAATAAVAKVCEMLRNRDQEAVVSGPLPAPTVGNAGATPASDAATARDAYVAVVVAGRLPVSWLPAPAAGPATTGGRPLIVAARDNVQTLVRACWPGALAPGLTSTRLRFAYVEARHTAVGVASSSDAAAAGVLARLRLWGFPGTRLAAGGGTAGAPAGPWTIAYRPGSLDAALALAGDLGLPPKSVVKIGDSPRKVVITPGQ